MNPTQPEVLDPSIVNLAKAIGKTESNGNYEAKGKSGEFGAYQFKPEVWKAWSKQHLGDENAPMTRENQDKVAYKQIESWGKQGYKPAQIASLWNSGKPEWEGNVGVNEHGVKFDTPTYVKTVGDAYTQIQGSSPQISQTSQTSTQTSAQNPQEETLGGQLKGRLTDLTSAVSNATSGKINPLSGVLQTAGAVAGGIGDVVNKGLELIPGVKEIEGAIGQGVGALAKTSVGQSVIKSIGEWSKKHPELAADIGAGFNIITAIPILKGLGAVKNVAMDAVASSLAKFAEKGAMKDLTATLERTVGGRNVLKETPEVVNTIVKERALPEIEGGRFTTQESYENLSNTISQIEDNELQAALQKASTSMVADRQPIEELRKETLKRVRNEFRSTGQVSKAEAEVNRVFDDYKNSYGDYVTLQDINDMKRGIRKSVNFNSPKLESDVTYHIGQTFQNDIESQAAKLGLGDIRAINKKMAELIKAQQALKYIDGRPVKHGLVGGLIREGIKDAATIGGEIAGRATNIPLAGTLAGRGVGALLSRGAERVIPRNVIREGVLSRTGKNAVRTPLKTSAKRIGGLLGAGTVNSIQNSK